MAFATIINQILFLAILTLCGIIAYRFKVIHNSAKDVIEKLVFYVTLPLLIITKLSSLSFTAEILRNGLFILFGTYLILFLQILAGKFTAELFKLKHAQSSVHILHTVLGNIVFLGFPLLDALFPGGEAILYAGIFQLAQNTVTWTYGIHTLNPASKERGFKNLKKLLNPNIVALCLGLIMMVFGIQFPQIIQSPLQKLHNNTSCL